MADDRPVQPRGRSRSTWYLGQPGLIEPLGIVRQPNGIWRMVFKRDGVPYYSSLHTRNERNAQIKWEEWKKRIKDLEIGH